MIINEQRYLYVVFVQIITIETTSFINCNETSTPRLCAFNFYFHWGRLIFRLHYLHVKRALARSASRNTCPESL